MKKDTLFIRDEIIKRVVNKFVDRSNVGFKKYGVTLNSDEQTLDTWLNHLQEELMDAVNYIEKARSVLRTEIEQCYIRDKNIEEKDEVRSTTMYPGGIKITYSHEKIKE